jgi:hypothetical protein
MKKTYKGSCHCGAVRFECDLDLAEGTTRCNCSFCAKARFWMAFAKGDAFRLLQGADVLTDYRHTPPSMSAPFLHLFFCSRCGVRPFTKGGSLPEFGGEFHAVNVACLNDVTDEELAQAPIRYADGRNDNWKATPAETRHL